MLRSSFFLDIVLCFFSRLGIISNMVVSFEIIELQTANVILVVKDRSILAMAVAEPYKYKKSNQCFLHIS